MLLLSLILSALACYVFICFSVLIRKVQRLSQMNGPMGGPLPGVSIVIPVRNEERHLEEALHSVLNLDYPPLEVLVIDDRSDDQTPSILREMSERYPELKILRIDNLPVGWLGKNHALHEGVKHTRAEWVLFTDADVVFDPVTLRKAVGVAVRESIDHLSLWPRFYSRNLLLDGFMTFFGYGLMLFIRPWAVSNPRSRAHMGVGAFNLVRRSTLNAIGGLESISLRPDDDIQLGRLIKEKGFRQQSMNGRDLIAVEWYATWGECLRGLEKNIFAVFHYDIRFSIGMTLFFVLVHIIPFVFLFVSHGLAQFFFGFTCVVLMLSLSLASFSQGAPFGYGLFYPLWAILELYILIRTPMKNLLDGGLQWRGTFYSLKTLRKQDVRKINR